MNRQEALIEIMKGNVVETKFGNKIYAENLDSGCPKFIFKSYFGPKESLLTGLDDGPFKLYVEKEFELRIRNGNRSDGYSYDEHTISEEKHKKILEILEGE